MNDHQLTSNHGNTVEFYRVKEDLLLKNFLDKSRRDKAKVLRLQQVKNYDEWLQTSIANTLSRIRNPSTGNNVLFTPSSLIQDAIKEGNKYEVLDLLSKGVPINFSATQGEGMTLLHQACVYDDYIIAQALIKQGAFLNIQDDYGCTPLHICCMWDSLKCAQLLVSNNAKLDILDNDGNFAVDLAPGNSHLKAMMQKHVQQKLKIGESQLSSLRNKTQKSMLQDIRQLLEDGSSVDKTSTAGVSMVKMVRLLLSHYANPHSRTTSGFTPRELAKDAEIINMLSNAEDTFLDLDNQRTPAKPKRFSASLLDQFDDEEDITRVPSRIISSTRSCKRDVLNEKQTISELGEELKQELKAEMEFQPPIVASSFGSSIPTWKQMLPPPIPPRDDPPQVHSPLHPPIKLKIYSTTNQVTPEDAKLKAVLTIQRAFRRYKKYEKSSPLDAALRTLEDYGNSFYDEMVLQNAEDIAKESDRERSRKTLQRKSWSNDLRRSVRSSVTNRPLSTGILYMSSPENAAVWLPQNPAHQGYSVPPDVIPHHQDPKGYWSTMPAQLSKRSKSLKHASIGSTDSGVSLSSNHKDQIELTKTVKHSLTISDPLESRRTNMASLTRKSSFQHHRPTSHPTYRMPPLTPTVATLIHTAAAPKKEASPKTRPKIMKQVATTDYSEENPYSVVDEPESLKFRSQSTREHRYGTLMSNRGSILKDARFQSLHQSETPVNRHSWNGEQEEGSTNFGRRTSSNLPVHPIVSPASYEMKMFTDGITSSSPPTPSAPTITGTLRKGSKEAKAPPPPRRAPTTKLSSNGDERDRSNSVTSFNRPQRHDLSLPLQNDHLQREGSNHVGMGDSSTDDELPVVPPPLPLCNPLVLSQKNEFQANNPNHMDLPAPPPPDVLLCDTMKRMESRQQNPSYDQGAYDFPPPPPTL